VEPCPRVACQCPHHAEPQFVCWCHQPRHLSCKVCSVWLPLSPDHDRRVPSPSNRLVPFLPIRSRSCDLYNARCAASCFWASVAACRRCVMRSWAPARI
jgi:hypothetical protein